MGLFMGLGLLVQEREDDRGDRLNKKCYQVRVRVRECCLVCLGGCSVVAVSLDIAVVVLVVVAIFGIVVVVAVFGTVVVVVVVVDVVVVVADVVFATRFPFPLYLVDSGSSFELDEMPLMSTAT